MSEEALLEVSFHRFSMCGNPKTYARMSGDMDVNAGRVILGESTIAE
jgi:altronate dehydratase